MWEIMQRISNNYGMQPPTHEEFEDYMLMFDKNDDGVISWD